MTNNETVTKAFRLLLPKMAKYIATELYNSFGETWWKDALYRLGDKGRDMPQSGTVDGISSKFDIAICLTLIDLYWSEVFRKKLNKNARSWAKELINCRNSIAHAGSDDMSKDDAARNIDTMARLCNDFDVAVAGTLREMHRNLLYGDEAAHVTPHFSSTSLPSWRDVMPPHPDIAEGRYKNSEFAADLAQVANGVGSIEYLDPVEFFNRTYITEGIESLISQAVRRVAGLDGDPVIQLKTAFGGGKTHSMLALYHLMTASVPLDKLASIPQILSKYGLKTLPKVNVAVLVGTALDMNSSRRPPKLPGVTVNTLWGEMVAQLAISAGKPELYDKIKASDKNSKSPGSAVFKEIFDEVGPCLILIDELVAYARKLPMNVNDKQIPAGTFANFQSFVQELTEAAKASKNSLVVASIPESHNEIGEELGQIALEAIEKTFGRLESIWKSANADEGFEIVRRRLFGSVRNENIRDRVCKAFSKMYEENQSDFPSETKEVNYLERMKKCYPIHPEVFDRLYGDWATLEGFQRTRGVLRLMSSVIHKLWLAGDSNPMIMPCSFYLYDSTVREELIKYLPDRSAWDGIIDSDIDGNNAVATKKDAEHRRFGASNIATRIARTIMLGSAPSVRGQAIRGISRKGINLGAVLPEENISYFNDALTAIHSSSVYLYGDPSTDRYYYDTRPTLKKLAQDRKSQIEKENVYLEIERLLSNYNTRMQLKLHKCPPSSIDVSDDDFVHLVILKPRDYYIANEPNCPAKTAAEDIYNNRGQSPRENKNMLIFLAAEKNPLESLEDCVKDYLAWKSIKDDTSLNLDTLQTQEASNNVTSFSRTVNGRLREAYRILLFPQNDQNGDIRKPNWDELKISSLNENIVDAAVENLRSNEVIISKWAPQALKLELDNLLWKDKDYILVKDLWSALCKYCYLPRLVSFSVLEDAIISGSEFAFASGVDNDGQFQNLRFSERTVGRDVLLVKADIAKRQVEATISTTPNPSPANPTETTEVSGVSAVSTASNAAPAQEQICTEFSVEFPLDKIRIKRDFEKCYDSIISHFFDLNDCDLKVTVNVEATSRSGFDRDTVRAVQENCTTYNVRYFFNK